MAGYALIDKTTSEQITPEEALLERQQGVTRKFFCPNPECRAILSPVNADENKHPFPFFRALRGNPHIPGCEFKAIYDEEAAKENARIRNAGLKESDFSINTLLVKMENYKRLESKNPQNPSTTQLKIQEEEKLLKEKLFSNTHILFNYCAREPIDKKLGDHQIKDFLIDSRTLYESYREEIPNGVYLLELPVKDFIYDKESATLQFKLNKKYLGNLSIKYNFILRFSTLEFFLSVRNRLYDYRETKSKIIILAEIKRASNRKPVYSCSIKNPAQLYFKESKELE